MCAAGNFTHRGHNPECSRYGAGWRLCDGVCTMLNCTTEAPHAVPGATVCQKCPIDTIDHDTDSATMCTHCPVGRFAPQGVTHCTVVLCPAGEGYVAGVVVPGVPYNDTCAVCAAGQFSSASDRTLCTSKRIRSCPYSEGYSEGTSSADDSRCTRCVDFFKPLKVISQVVFIVMF
jgi:hypothetical protein